MSGLQKPGDEHFGFGRPESQNHPTPGGGTIDQRFINDLANLVLSSAPFAFATKLLADAPKRGGIPEVRAEGKQEGVTRNASGTGIASPLTEGGAGDTSPVVTRVYYSPEVVLSTDGILAFEIEQLQSIAFNDANGNSVTIIYGQET